MHAASHGIDAGRLAVGGDSAGGTLAATLCIALKNAGQRQPSLQVLLYPCTSNQQNSPSHDVMAGVICWRRNPAMDVCTT
jgi:acetyl esterase